MIVLMSHRSSQLFVAATLLLSCSMVGCATTSSEVSRQGGHITLAPGDAERDLYMIDRDDWNDAYAQGPSWVMQQIEVRPVVHKERFFGFQILNLFPGRPASTPLALKVGDIIRRVNGQSIERPDQYMTLWEANRFATSLTVEILRDRRHLEITWAVGDYPVVPAPRAASVTLVPPYPLPSESQR